MKKTIFNVNPWNELYYNNCYYSALFAMLLHFNKSISPVLLSNMFFYNKKEHEGDLFVDLQRNSIFEDKQYNEVQEMGITEVVYNEVDDVISCIKQCIDRDTLPMIWIDCFYETIRPDAYLKNHWVHILLVYGYDDETATVEFLEHSYTDSFTYKRAHMSYEDMRNSYNGFVSNLTNGDFKGFIEFNQSNNEVDICKYTVEITKKYIEKMIESKDTAYQGIDTLLTVINNWKSMSYEKFFRDAVFRKNFLMYLEHIIKIKQMERYNLKKALNAPSELIDMSTDILMQWRNVHGLCAFLFDENKSYTDIFYCLDKLYQSEKALLDRTYEFLTLKQKQMNYSIIDLEPYFNGISISNTGIVPDGVNQFCVSSNPIIPDTLPESGSIINFEGVPIRMPDKRDDKYDHIMLYGQRISLNPGKYIRIYLLGVGEITSKVEMYSKGYKVSESTIFFHDAWTGIDIWEGGPHDNRIIAKVKNRGKEGAVQSMYLLEIEINTRNEVDEIRLPLSPSIKVYGMTLEYEVL